MRGATFAGTTGTLTRDFLATFFLAAGTRTLYLLGEKRPAFVFSTVGQFYRYLELVGKEIADAYDAMIAR